MIILNMHFDMVINLCNSLVLKEEKKNILLKFGWMFEKLFRARCSQLLIGSMQNANHIYLILLIT